MDLKNIKDKMRPFKDAAASVGIFWVDTESQELRDVEASQLQLTGKEHGPLTHNRTHRTKWQKLSNHAKKRKQSGKDYDAYYLQDYSQIPRGRVWFDADSGNYFVTVGDWYKEIESWLRPLIVDEFDIPEDFEFKVQEHWQLGHGWSEDMI